MTILVKNKTEKKANDEKPITWLDDIKQESIDNYLKSGVIYPSFKPIRNKTYRIRVLSLPEYVESVKGNFFVIKIEKEGMIFSMIINNSFRFHLLAIIRKTLVSNKEIIGKELFIIKDDEGFFSIQFVRYES